MRSSRISTAWGRLAVLVLALALVVPTVVVAAGAAVAQDGGGKVLRVHHPTYPDVVDPQKSSYTYEIDILAAVYEGLTRLDTNQQTVGAAAESWEYNEEATELTFALREGLTYSDGSPLTAENFRYAVERTCDPLTAGEYQSILFEIVGCADFAALGAAGEGTPEASPVTDEARQAAIDAIGAEVVDDRTLKLTFTNPAPYFHTIAYTWVFYPVKREIAEADPDNWWKTPENHIGNGPFRVTEISEDQRWVFEANENYWQGRPLLDGMEYTYIDDAAVALESYRAGDLDIVQLEPPQIPEVEADPELSEAFLTYPTGSTYTLAMKLNQAPFDDVKVRQAFSQAFDRETFCAEIRSGDCAPTLTWIPEGIPGAIESDAFGFDPEAAQATLAESSYGGPEGLPEITLTVNSDLSGYQERAEFVAEMYRENLGVEIGIEPVDGTTLTSLRKDNATHPQLLLVGGWIGDYPDAQNWLSVFWTCASTFADRVGYCNEEFDALVRQGDTTIDPAQREQFYQQAGEILVQDQPGPFLYNLLGTFVVNPRVTGITPVASEAEWPGSLASLMTIDIAAE
jgi:oligopeptide transport system substrate-binding protein